MDPISNNKWQADMAADAADEAQKDRIVREALRRKRRGKRPPARPKMAGYGDVGSQLGMQQYAPIHGERRQLSPEEEAAAAAGEKRWLPRIFQSMGTPLSETMSSPGKGALMSGLGLGALGAGLGGVAGGSLGEDSMGAPTGAAIGAALGGLGLGGVGAASSYFGRKAKNEGVREMMSRLPENATIRDLHSDPAFQADARNKAQQMDPVLMAMIASSMAKQSEATRMAVTALGDPRPPHSNAVAQPPSVANGGVTSFGQEAWDSLSNYMPPELGTPSMESQGISEGAGESGGSQATTAAAGSTPAAGGAAKIAAADPWCQGFLQWCVDQGLSEDETAACIMKSAAADPEANDRWVAWHDELVG